MLGYFLIIIGVALLYSSASQVKEVTKEEKDYHYGMPERDRRNYSGFSHNPEGISNPDVKR